MRPLREMDAERETREAREIDREREGGVPADTDTLSLLRHWAQAEQAALVYRAQVVARSLARKLLMSLAAGVALIFAIGATIEGLIGVLAEILHVSTAISSFVVGVSLIMTFLVLGVISRRRFESSWAERVRASSQTATAPPESDDGKEERRGA
jgi:hypothetical protein